MFQMWEGALVTDYPRHIMNTPGPDGSVPFSPEQALRVMRLAWDVHKTIPQEAAVYFAWAMQSLWDHDFSEWTDGEILDEFGWWVSGARLAPEDEGGPKQEWIDAYEKE
jgi:hypothetical protein